MSRIVMQRTFTQCMTRTGRVCRYTTARAGAAAAGSAAASDIGGRLRQACEPELTPVTRPRQDWMRSANAAAVRIFRDDRVLHPSGTWGCRSAHILQRRAARVRRAADHERDALGRVTAT